MVEFNTYNHRLRYPVSHCAHLDLDPAIGHSANFRADNVRHAPFFFELFIYFSFLFFRLVDPFWLGFGFSQWRVPAEFSKFYFLVRLRLFGKGGKINKEKISKIFWGIFNVNCIHSYMAISTKINYKLNSHTALNEVCYSERKKLFSCIFSLSTKIRTKRKKWKEIKRQREWEIWLSKLSQQASKRTQQEKENRQKVNEVSQIYTRIR